MIPELAIDRLSAMFRSPDVSGTRYELVSVLGRGGMGVVYLARDTALDREVALKIFDRPSGEANEARLIARLEHPGIVPVHDVGELPDGRLFYAMKLVRGDRLDRWMAAGRDIVERLGVFLRVCETVAFAHAHGVIHRDLKPENVMVGEFGEVLVLDWGISTELSSADCGLRIADRNSADPIAGSPD
jgi:serine/threonine protein kinase